MKKRFSFSSAQELRASTSSADALHHRVWPGMLILDEVFYGHTLMYCGITGAGKSSLSLDVMKTALRTPHTGGQYAQ